jgi:hypothetical protein
MARAIEGSYLVLVCITEKYKLSPNCRAVIKKRNKFYRCDLI